jgi:hypothetical protein
MAAQGIAHGLVGHLMPQVGQGSHNPVVAPAGVLASQANHQILDLWTGARPARRAAPFAAVEFFSYPLAIPGKNAIRFGDARDLLQAFASEAPADFRQGGPLAIGEPPGCRRVFKMRFSAARYSFCSRSSWLTNPVT